MPSKIPVEPALLMPSKTRLMRPLCLFSCFLLALAACDDAQGGDGRIGPDFHDTFLDSPGAQAGGSGGGPPSPGGSGGSGGSSSTLPETASCTKLKSAVCDWMGRCSEVDPRDCEKLTDALVCKADPVISPCAKAAPFACGPWPKVCSGGFDGVFDGSAAIQDCNNLAKAWCSRKCMPTSTSAIAQCIKEVSTELQCSNWLATYPNFSSCLKAIPSWSCVEEGIPEICNAVGEILVQDP